MRVGTVCGLCFQWELKSLAVSPAPHYKFEIASVQDQLMIVQSSMKNIFYILLAVFSFTAWAHPPKAYITMEPGLFSGAEIVVNGKVAKDFAEAMKDNSLAYEFAKKHRSYAIWANVALFGGLGGALIYLAASRPDTNFGTYWSIFGAGFITSIGFAKASQSYFHKAINAYNGVDGMSSQYHFSVTPIENGGAAMVSHDF